MSDHGENGEAGETEKTSVEYQPFWWTAKWRPVIPDTVLAHLNFRLKGKASCERKARIQGVSLLVISASVPVAAAAEVPRWSIALLGALATIVAGVGQLYGWKEATIRENRSLMQIQQQLVFWKIGQPHYRVVKTSPGAGEAWDADNDLLMMRVERIVQSEGEGWATSFDRDHGDEPAAPGTQGHGA